MCFLTETEEISLNNIKRIQNVQDFINMKMIEMKTQRKIIVNDANN